MNVKLIASLKNFEPGSCLLFWEMEKNKNFDIYNKTRKLLKLYSIQHQISENVSVNSSNQVLYDSRKWSKTELQWSARREPWEDSFILSTSRCSNLLPRMLLWTGGRSLCNEWKDYSLHFTLSLVKHTRIARFRKIHFSRTMRTWEKSQTNCALLRLFHSYI